MYAILLNTVYLIALSHFFNSSGQNTIVPGMMMMRKPHFDPAALSSILVTPFVTKKIANTSPVARYKATRSNMI